MRYDNCFIRTVREDPADAELVSHTLMVRAGMIQKVASGIYNYLPLGLRVIRKVENIIRREMAACGAAELLMPTVVPAELWQESGRWSYYGPELLRITDRKDADFCLGPTHEEVVVDIARRGIRSYRDLPACLYQIQTKFRDEIRPRFGLMRGREFIMKDAYSFHADEESLEKTYWVMHEAYTRIFSQCGLDFRPVEADSGAIGGDVTHEFHVLADSGEDTIVYCKSCDYAANIEKAAARYTTSPSMVENNEPAIEEVATPGKKTIEDVSGFLGINPADTIKMVVYRLDDTETFVAVCIRGDREVNEAKLRRLTGAENVSIPDDKTLREATGLSVGFIGALGEKHAAVKEIIGDYSVCTMSDCVCGANKEDVHCKHVYPQRDLVIDRYEDVGFVSIGDTCASCDGGTLDHCRGIEVGQVFKLGKKYTTPMNMTFLGENGEPQVPTMGCYGIGVGRTAAAAIEQNHDKDGIIWPVPIAPFAVALLCLDPGDPDIMDAAQSIHDTLEDAGIDVLLDDRNERPGVKFKDADLIGCPLRLVVGARGMKEGVVEMKIRRDGTMEKVTLDRVVDAVKNYVHTQ